MAESARSQLQGMAGLHSSKAGKVVKTPVGFGVITTVFADMKRHFSGSWFVGVDNQQDLIERAIAWRHALSRYNSRVVEDAMAEVIVRGDVSAPSLDTLRYLCQRLTDEGNSVNNRAAAKAARDRAMANLKNQGVIRG